jgi:hypothetical protein
LYPRLAISTPRYSHELFESSTAQEFRSQWATNRRKDAESTFVSGYMSAKRRVKRGNPVASSGAHQPRRIVIPWFALGFVAVAAFNSMGVLPKTMVGTAISLDTVILAMAMAALGVTTHVSAIRAAGVKPLALAASLFAWLILGGARSMRHFSVARLMHTISIGVNMPGPKLDGARFWRALFRIIPNHVREMYDNQQPFRRVCGFLWSCVYERRGIRG